MNSSPHSPTRNAIPRNPFRRTLLQPVLHNISAIAPVTHFDAITYQPNRRKSRKSLRRLLLPLFVPVTPLGAHSYKKMGGTPSPQEISRLETLTTCVMYHLQTSRISRQKTPNVFYRLQTPVPVTTFIFTHLGKKGEGVEPTLLSAWFHPSRSIQDQASRQECRLYLSAIQDLSRQECRLYHDLL